MQIIRKPKIIFKNDSNLINEPTNIKQINKALTLELSETYLEECWKKHGCNYCNEEDGCKGQCTSDNVDNDS